MNLRRWILIASICVTGQLCRAGAPVLNVGDTKTLAGWTGLTRAAGQSQSGADCAALVSGTEAIFTYAYPADDKGWYKQGMRVAHDGTSDWRDYYGIQFDVKLPDEPPTTLATIIYVPQQDVRVNFIEQTTATISVRGAGWHQITLPWSAFDFYQAQPAFLKFVHELRIKSSTNVLIDNVRVIRAAKVALESDVRGKSAARWQDVEYAVAVSNCTDQPQAISLSIQRHGWEAMTATVEPATMSLAPMESKSAIVRVTISDRIPPGGQETQTLIAIANGDAAGAGSITFSTASALPHPNIMHTAAEWQEIRHHVKEYEWAKRGQDEYVRRADDWVVPEIAPEGRNISPDNHGRFLFQTPSENGLMASAISWQLTGEKKYADKVATFLKRLSDPTNGYPTTLCGCNQSLVQEGHFFQHIAMAYDMVLDSGVLTDADQKQINATLRIFIETMRLERQTGHIGNWNVSEYCGALYSALAMQDPALADEFLNSPAGIIDQLEKGTMDDGWWYECAISYNTWVASEFSQVAIAMRPWGLNLADANFPISYPKYYSLDSLGDEAGPVYGMSFDKFGPVKSNSINIKRMWDALPVFADYQGMMFGVNDSTERHLAGNRTEVGGQPFEIAYYLYRDPAYATIIKQGRMRDVLYAVPDLPAKTPDLSTQSAYADNVGVVMLRSQTENRPQKDRIEAVLHYGTHGGYHGHFDRTSLLSLMRYGRTFFNPEMIWYGYEPYLYKFYVQSSIDKNMVTVDQLMQEPVESDRLLFHSGKMMQATAVQTNARWSHEPFGGMIYDWFNGGIAEKMWSEGRSFPFPEDAPKYGDIGPYSDRVLQRRLMIVTADYVVLADYLKGEKEHAYDNLMQIRGFESLDAPDKKLIRHDGQWATDPRCAAQFVTDCDVYQAAAPSRAKFNDPAYKVDVISASGRRSSKSRSARRRSRNRMKSNSHTQCVATGKL